MSEADERLSVLRQWVQKAENDLKNAAYTLQMGEDSPTDTVCFHAQRCVEKYVKRAQGDRFPQDPWPRRLAWTPANAISPTISPVR